jgi:site-specific DNA-methyltransferase (adenine-specific)
VIPEVAEVLAGTRSHWLINSPCLDPDLGLATLPAGAVTHVLMDPPYSERVHAKFGTEGRSDGAKSRDELTFAPLTEELAIGVAEQACRVAARWLLIFCDEISLVLWHSSIKGAGGDYVRKGTWVKSDAMPQMNGDHPSVGTEEIVVGHAPRPRGVGRTSRMRWNGGGKPATYIGRCQESHVTRVHPTQKPLWLFEALVRDFTDIGDLVIDPFAGSATTGVACLRLGRRFIGWEQHGPFYQAAMKRLAETREQPELITQEQWAREAKQKRKQMGLDLDAPFEDEQ